MWESQSLDSFDGAVKRVLKEESKLSEYRSFLSQVLPNGYAGVTS